MARRGRAVRSPAASAWDPLLRFLRSASFRFALLFAGVFSAAAVLFALVLWYATAGSLDRQTDAALRTDAYGLAERWREAGPSAVTRGNGPQPSMLYSGTCVRRASTWRPSRSASTNAAEKS